MEIISLVEDKFKEVKKEKAIVIIENDCEEKTYSTNDPEIIFEFYKKICNNEDYDDNIKLIPYDKRFPLIINFQLDLNNAKKKPYDERLYHNFIHSCQSAIVENYICNNSTDEVICYVFDYSGKIDNVYSINVRFYFPYISFFNMSEYKDIKKTLIENLKTNNFKETIKKVDKINYNHVIDFSYSLKQDIITNADITKNYKGCFFNIEEDEITDIDDKSSFLIECLISNGLENDYNKLKKPPKYLEKLLTIVKDENETSEDFDLEKWIPLFLSPQNTPHYNTKRKKKIEIKRYDDDRKTFGMGFSKIITDNRDDKEKNDKELCHILLPMLSNERYYDFASCELIGQALYNTYQGSQEGLEKWKDLCVTAYEDSESPLPQFIEERTKDNNLNKKVSDFCISNYENYSSTFITVKTIAWYAQLDNNEEYSKWLDSWIREAMESTIINSGEMDFAQVFYRYFWLDIAYSHKKQENDGLWYIFSNHIWIDALKNVLLMDKANKIRQLYENVAQEVATATKNSIDENEKTKLDKIMKDILAIKKKLSNYTFFSKVIKSSCSLFLIDDFDKKLDSNNSLLGVKNGVLEMIGNTIKHRQGMPEDFISHSTCIPYKDLTMRDPNVKELMEWINQMHPKKENAEFFIRYLSSFLHGDNMGNYFLIWKGKTGNSKSTFTKLLRSTLGDYFLTLPPSVITANRKNNLGKAIPELAYSKGRRAGVVEETRKSDNLNEQVIKSISGLDSMFVRTLYSKGGIIDISFKLAIVCNDPPVPQNIDLAFIRRVLIIEFIGTYSEDAPEDPEEQKKRNIYPMKNEINKSLKRLSTALLWLMTQKYSDFQRIGLSPPPDIKKLTREYIEEQDKYEMFINSETEFIKEYGQPDRSVFLNTLTVYDEFKFWVGNLFESFPKPEYTDFIKKMSEKWGSPEDNTWYGRKLKNDNKENTSLF